MAAPGNAVVGEPKFEWDDVSDVFLAAPVHLALGEMLQVEEFNLSSVISAVEIMDPKMDGGYGGQDCWSLDELLEVDRVLTSPTDRQALDIMDHLLMCELTWHRGFGLPQTVYTCIYIHRPTILQHTPLLVYTKALMKGVDRTSIAVARADISEDEEFLSMTFSNSVDLLVETPMADIVEELAAAERDLEAAIAADDAESNLRKALLTRLRFRRHYLVAIDAMEQSKGEEAVQSLKAAATELHLLREQRDKELGGGGGIEVLDRAFSEHAIKWAACQSPMRVIPMVDWSDAAESLSRHLSDLTLACDLPSYTTLPELIRFAEHYAEGGSKVPGRAFMWLAVFELSRHEDVGLMTLKSLADDYGAPLYLRCAEDPIEVTTELPETANADTKSKYRLKRATLGWAEHVAQFVYKYLRLCCFNRCRQRRKLAKLFREIGMLQQVSQEIDVNAFEANAKQAEYAQCFVLSAYINDIAYQAMLNYLIMGFELNVYSPWEHHMIYWYMDYVISQRLENFATLHADQGVRDRILKVGKGKRSRRFPPAFATRSASRPPQFVAFCHEAIHNLARMTHRFLAAIMKDHPEVGAPPDTPFGTAEVRHEYRLHPFLHLMRPRYVFYATYRQFGVTKQTADETLDIGLQILTKVDSILTAASQMREGLRRYELEIPGPLLKVCKANLLSMRLYQSGHNRTLGPGEVIQVEYDFAYHKGFPVIKLKKRQGKADDRSKDGEEPHLKKEAQ